MYGPLRWVFFVCYSSSLINTLSACDYQRLDPGHTMCIYPPQGCSGNPLIRSGGLTCQEKQDILDSHNRLRQNLALGQIRDQPPALDMRELVWDDELAAVAQRWADQCKSGHDRRRSVDRFNVGQNVASTWTFNRPSPLGDVPEFEAQIQNWFNEVTTVGFSSREIKPFRFNYRAGHYSQMAWSTTTSVGCGYTYFQDPQKGYTKLYVCNYGPGGNIIGGSMYHAGTPGVTNCISDGLVSSSKYAGLCQAPNGGNYNTDRCSSTPTVYQPPVYAPPVYQPAPPPVYQPKVYKTLTTKHKANGLRTYSLIKYPKKFKSSSFSWRN